MILKMADRFGGEVLQEKLRFILNFCLLVCFLIDRVELKIVSLIFFKSNASVFAVAAHSDCLNDELELKVFLQPSFLEKMEILAD